MNFYDRLYADDGSQGIWVDAQAMANRNDAPVAVLSRDGWLAICDYPPDDPPEGLPIPADDGWTERAIIVPMAVSA